MTETARKRIALLVTVGVLLMAVSVARWPDNAPPASLVRRAAHATPVRVQPPPVSVAAESARVAALPPPRRVIPPVTSPGAVPIMPVAPTGTTEAETPTPGVAPGTLPEPALLVAELAPSTGLAFAVIPNPTASPEPVEPADRPGAVTRAFGVAGRGIRGGFGRTGAALRQAF